MAAGHRSIGIRIRCRVYISSIRLKGERFDLISFFLLLKKKMLIYFFFLRFSLQTCYEMERYLKDEPQQPSSSPLCSSSALRRAESFDMLSSIQPASYLAPDSVNSPMWPWSFKQEPVDPDTDPDDGCQLLRAHKHHHQIALRYGFPNFLLLAYNVISSG